MRNTNKYMMCYLADAMGIKYKTLAELEVYSEKFSKLGQLLSEYFQAVNAKYHDREAAIVAEAGRRGAVTIATNMAGRGTDIKLDDTARKAGGLLVIGTERYDSRRVDDQLRGRSGRQGDPGESRFYLSLEDSLLRLYGGKNPAALLLFRVQNRFAFLKHRTEHRHTGGTAIAAVFNNDNESQRIRIIQYKAGEHGV